MTERKSHLATLESLDSGKPLDETLWDMVLFCSLFILVKVGIFLYSFFFLMLVLFDLLQEDVAGCFEFYADLAEGLDAKQKAPVSLPMETFKSYVLKQPLGVVGLITPW